MVAVNGLEALILANTVSYIDSTSLYLAVGTGTTPVSASDTTLETETGRYARQDHSTTSDTVTISGYITATQENGNTLTEVGVLTAAVAGTLYSHDLYTAIVKSNSIEIWFDTTYTIDVTLNV